MKFPAVSWWLLLTLASGLGWSPTLLEQPPGSLTFHEENGETLVYLGPDGARFEVRPLEVWNGQRRRLNAEGEAACAGSETIDPSTEPGRFALHCCGFIAVLLIYAIVAGLTLGLLSIEPMKLELISRENPALSGRVKIVQRATQNKQWLMVTLLVVNSACTTLGPLMLEPVAGPALTFVIGTICVTLFAEILPQAMCMSNPVELGSRCAWLAVGFMYSPLAIIAWPLAKLLDAMGLKQGGMTMFTRSELKNISDLYQELGNCTLQKEEVMLVRGVMSMYELKVPSVMVKWEKVDRVDVESIITSDFIQRLIRSGHSRYPVYTNHQDNIIGILLMKDLLGKDPDSRLPIRQFVRRNVRAIPCDMNLLDALEHLQGAEIFDVICHLPEGDDTRSLGIQFRIDQRYQLPQIFSFSQDGPFGSSQPKTYGPPRTAENAANAEGEEARPSMRIIPEEVELQVPDNRSEASWLEKHKPQVGDFIIAINSKDTKEMDDIKEFVLEQDTRTFIFTLKRIQRLRCHMAIVSNSTGEQAMKEISSVGFNEMQLPPIMPPGSTPIGAITLEDIFEKIIGEPIEDEHDVADRAQTLIQLGQSRRQLSQMTQDTSTPKDDGAVVQLEPGDDAKSDTEITIAKGRPRANTADGFKLDYWLAKYNLTMVGPELQRQGIATFEQLRALSEDEIDRITGGEERLNDRFLRAVRKMDENRMSTEFRDLYDGIIHI